jgi:hypothetical protein
VAVDITLVIQKKLDALSIMESQFYEVGANGHVGLTPTEPEKQKKRKQDVRDNFARRYQSIADRFRGQLGDWYGPDRAQSVKYAEAFELCEYGRQPDKKELRRLFPFFGE